MKRESGEYYDIAFYIVLIVCLILGQVSLGFYSANREQFIDLAESRNNSIIWMNTADRILEVHQSTLQKCVDDMWGNCEVDCYRFQLDWGHSDADYCNNYCQDKYDHLFIKENNGGTP